MILSGHLRACMAAGPPSSRKAARAGRAASQATAVRASKVVAPTFTKPDPAEAAVSRRTLLLGLLVATQAPGLTSSFRAWADEVPDITTVFVAGSTGRTGRRVVQQLRAAGYKVRAGVRDVRKAQSLGFAFDSGIEIVQADVTKDVRSLESAIGDAQAVICATGATGFGSASPTSVDELGTIRLIDAAKARGVKAFVLQTSLLTNAVAVGQRDNPNYKFLNLFGGVLDHKLAAEKYLKASGLRFTIVRPGGLSDKPPSEVGELIVSQEDSLFGLDTDPGRAISRDTVAAVLVAALWQPSAADKVVEIVGGPGSSQVPEEKWFRL